jgi:hypothetical protein
MLCLMARIASLLSLGMATTTTTTTPLPGPIKGTVLKFEICSAFNVLI